MADTTLTKHPDTVVETDAVPANSVVTLDTEEQVEAVIRVTVGTVKFAVGTPAVAGSPAYTSSSEPYIAILRGGRRHPRKLNFLAAAQNDAFTIEY